MSCREPPNLHRGKGRAEAVVDVYHGDAGAAGIQHTQQRGNAAKAGPVADTGRYRNHWSIDKPGDRAGQGTFHAGNDDEHACFTQQLGVGKQTVDTRDADIVEALHGLAKCGAGDGGFFGDGRIAGAGAEHGDFAGQFRERLIVADLNDTRGRMPFGFGVVALYGAELFGIGAGDEGKAFPHDELLYDGGHLCGRFALAKNNFANALAAGAIGVYLGVAQIGEPGVRRNRLRAFSHSAEGSRFWPLVEWNYKETVADAEVGVASCV